MLALGLTSGAALDGIDAALLEIRGDAAERVEVRPRASLTVPFEVPRRARIRDVLRCGDGAALAALHADLGDWFADAAGSVCAGAGLALDRVEVIGVRGIPVGKGGSHGAALRLGDSVVVAERTGCAVVSGFRAPRSAPGGAAALWGWADQVLFARPDRAVAVLALGGVGSVGLVPAGAGTGTPLVSETGPGTLVIDAAVEVATDGRLACDPEGRLAAQGGVDEVLLDQLLAHPFLRQALPRDGAAEQLGESLVRRLVEAARPEGDRDWLELVATLTEWVARSVAEACEAWLLPRGVEELVVTGGGARNRTLVGRIRSLLAPLPVTFGSDRGVEPQARGATACTLLAWAHLRGAGVLACLAPVPAGPFSGPEAT